ncbi:TolC family protein [Pedobacter sp. PWIIR3]
MNNSRKAKSLLLFLLLTCLFTKQSMAQESVLSQISDLYVNKLIATAKENYPRIKVFSGQVAASKSELSTAKASWLDPFSFQYVARSNKAQANLVDVTTQDILTGYQFGISVNPGSLFSKPGQVRKAKEQVKIAEFNQQEYNLTLETEVKQRYYRYLQAKLFLKPTNDALIDAESTFKVVKLAYQKAEITLVEYNNGSTAYNQAYSSKVQAEVDYMTAKALLEELTVKKLEEIK